MSFRLTDADVSEALTDVARSMNVSKGLASKFLVVQALRGGGDHLQPPGELDAALSELFGELESVRDDIAEVQRLIADLRRCLVTSLETVLLNVTTEDPASIRAWVSAKFGSSEPPVGEGS